MIFVLKLQKVKELHLFYYKQQFSRHYQMPFKYENYRLQTKQFLVFFSSYKAFQEVCTIYLYESFMFY